MEHHSYRFLGLQIAADHPIHGLEPSHSEAFEVQLRIDPDELPTDFLFALDPSKDFGQDAFRTVLRREDLEIFRTADGERIWYHYEDGTEFLIEDGGARVRAKTPPHATLDDTLIYLLGPIVGCILRLRGTLALHASAVEIDDHAVAFLGPAGAGKSTLAAAFGKLGHPILTDDVTALREVRGMPYVQPGSSYLRLWPGDGTDALGWRELPHLTPGWDKRRLDLGKSGPPFRSTPAPLGAIYLLEADPAAASIGIEPLDLREGFMAVIANTYASYMLNRSMRVEEMRQVGSLLQRVMLRRLRRPPGADPCEVSSAVLSDVRSRLTEPRVPKG